MADPYSVTLGDLTIDGETLDSDGDAIWRATSLDGWMDSPPGELTASEIQPLGQDITRARYTARAIAAEFIARDPLDNTALGPTAVARAQLRIKRAIASAVVAPGLFVVADPILTLQASVRMAQPMRMRIDGDNGFLTVQVPLVCPDPRRYDVNAETISLAPGSNTITNNGDMPTPVILEAAAGTNPSWQNTTAQGDPTLAVTGSGDVVIDTNAERVSIDGVDTRSALTTAQWWQLVPGDNTIVASDASTISYQHAYS